MKALIGAVALAVAAGTAAADEFVTKNAGGTVPETMDRLESAVIEAGATVFARINHSGAAAAVGMELADAQLLIFGNPQLGTPVMLEDLRAGLVLPLRVLVYDDDGQTVILYQVVDEMLDDLDVDDNLEVLARIDGALDMLTDKAAGG